MSDDRNTVPHNPEEVVKKPITVNLWQFFGVIIVFVFLLVLYVKNDADDIAKLRAQTKSSTEVVIVQRNIEPVIVQTYESLHFTIKAQFAPNRYEAICHDINEECVLESTTELPLYKTEKYEVTKLGRKSYNQTIRRIRIISLERNGVEAS